ncbi:hypothetical protein ONE63_003942 [Megalurothrips usitatus]|uniref:Uncharacterized protein n=1 Tax=Megalurothrips usitatus TaxID=439358 RepID=A0AAV7X4K7_9NEOP|nr:hypothetical protein ONE63_003942 [Megalurothrips usitatus]
MCSDGSPSLLCVLPGGDLSANGPASWSGSERDLAVPPKRRRQDDVVGYAAAPVTVAAGGGGGVALSRSSSLIAFESLERRLSEEEEALAAGGLGAFRTTATLRPFDWADSRSPTPPSAPPSDSSDDEDSDDSLMQSFNSSRGSFRSSAGSERLRSFRSLDSLSALNALGGGTVNSGGAAYLSRPCQDLSLSSDGDGAAADGVLGRQERSHSLSPKPSLRSLLDATYSLSDREDHTVDRSAAMTRGDFLDEPDEDIVPAHLSTTASSRSSSSSSSSSSSRDTDHDLARASATTESTPVSARTQRSAENLSEDSGFGEHAAYPPKRLTVCPILEDDDVPDDDASCSSSCYSACSSSSGGGGGVGRKPKDVMGKDMGVNLEWGAGDAKFSAGWHRSAPDLLVCALAAVADAHPQLPHPLGLLAGPPTMASTPDLAVAASAPPASALAQPHSPTDKGGLTKALSSKGVHFCPVVAEVSWRESYSDGDDEDEDDVDGADGRHREEDDDEDDEEDEEDDEDEQEQGVAYKLHVGGVVGSAVPGPSAAAPAAPHPAPAAVAVPVAVPVAPPRAPPRSPARGPAPAPPTAGAPLPASQAPARSVVSMAAPQTQPPGPPGPRPLSPAGSTSPSSSPKKTSRFGDFFQRFSLRRLSGRHHDHAKKLSRSKSAPSSPHPPASLSRGTNTKEAAVDEDVRIIPLHPTPEELEAERREEERRRLASKPPLPPSAPPRLPRGLQGVGAGAAHAHRGATAGAAHEPRDVVAAAAAAAVTAAVAWRSSSSMAGLLETDLDADLPVPAAGAGAAAAPRGVGGCNKARSLLDVSAEPRAHMTLAPHHHHHHHRDASPDTQDNSSRAKSMEFLLDRRNQEAVQVSVRVLCQVPGRGPGAGGCVGCVTAVQ